LAQGCCWSGEEEAAKTSIPPPQAGTPIRVKLQKQGLLDADYDVLDMTKPDTPRWMLVDTVGGIGSNDMRYYLKHRFEVAA
jgi:hypothetical protein